MRHRNSLGGLVVLLSIVGGTEPSLGRTLRSFELICGVSHPVFLSDDEGGEISSADNLRAQRLAQLLTLMAEPSFRLTFKPPNLTLYAPTGEILATYDEGTHVKDQDERSNDDGVLRFNPKNWSDGDLGNLDVWLEAPGPLGDYFAKVHHVVVNQDRFGSSAFSRGIYLCAKPEQVNAPHTEPGISCVRNGSLGYGCTKRTREQTQ